MKLEVTCLCYVLCIYSNISYILDISGCENSSPGVSVLVVTGILAGASHTKSYLIQKKSHHDLAVSHHIKVKIIGKPCLKG